MIAVLLSTLLLAAEPAAPASPATVAVTATPRTAATAPRPTKVANNSQPLTCWLEKPAGSHITRTVCATLEELDKAKRDADDALNARNVGRLGANGATK